MKGRAVNGVVCAVGAIAVAMVLGAVAASPSEGIPAGMVGALAVISGAVTIPAIALSAVNSRGLRAADASARASLRRGALIAVGTAGALVVAVGACVIAAGATADALALGALALVMPVFALVLGAATASGLKRSAEV